MAGFFSKNGALGQFLGGIVDPIGDAFEETLSEIEASEETKQQLREINAAQAREIAERSRAEQLTSAKLGFSPTQIFAGVGLFVVGSMFYNKIKG